MTAQPWPDHLLSLDEWDALPQDRSRSYELVEGVLYVVPRPSPRHQRVLYNLQRTISDRLPTGLTALADVEVTVEGRHPATVRAPDLIVLPTEVARLNASRTASSDVLLAVEVVSPGTGRTDRVTKLSEYADAGIPHYWIVELEPRPGLTVFRLGERGYEQIASGSSSVTVTDPVSLTVDVPALTSWD